MEKSARCKSSYVPLAKANRSPATASQSCTPNAPRPVLFPVQANQPEAHERPWVRRGLVYIKSNFTTDKFLDMIDPTPDVVRTSWQKYVDRVNGVAIFFQLDVKKDRPTITKCVKIPFSNTTKNLNLLPRIYIGDTLLPSTYVETVIGQTFLSDISDLIKLLENLDDLVVVADEPVPNLSTPIIPQGISLSSHLPSNDPVESAPFMNMENASTMHISNDFCTSVPVFQSLQLSAVCNSTSHNPPVRSSMDEDFFNLLEPVAGRRCHVDLETGKFRGSDVREASPEIGVVSSIVSDPEYFPTSFKKRKRERSAKKKSSREDVPAQQKNSRDSAGRENGSVSRLREETKKKSTVVVNSNTGKRSGPFTTWITEDQHKFLLETRLSMENEFRSFPSPRERQHLWSKILDLMKERWLYMTLTSTQIQKRYENSLQRYQREKRKEISQGIPVTFAHKQIFDQLWTGEITIPTCQEEGEE